MREIKNRVLSLTLYLNTFRFLMRSRQQEETATMLRYLTILFSLIILIAFPAHATRIALVIGNGDYDQRLNPLGLDKLDNPVNDARDMALVLENLGFEVILKTNLRKKKAMKRAVRHFAKRLERGGKVGVFYFSGHGFQHNNVNYLVPLQADIHSQHDIEDEALKAKYVLDWMESSHQGVNVMILDACRESIPDDLFRKSKGGVCRCQQGFEFHVCAYWDFDCLCHCPQQSLLGRIGA